jgi:uncharacterized SAM-binding protein YcdF (DUF218 family)
MDVLFFTKKLLSALILPPTAPLLLVLAGLILLRRLPRLGQGLAWAGSLTLLLLSLPMVSSMLLDVATTTVPFEPREAREAKAIVILGGGRKHAPEYGGETVSEFSLERVRYGAKLARELGLPILVTAGTVYGEGRSEGDLMAAALQSSFAMPVRWIENRSRDTHENAEYSARILRGAGIDIVVLVTHDYHQRRALAEFSAAGIRAVPAPVTLAPPNQNRSFLEHLPSAGALQLSSMAIHELLGYLVLAPKERNEGK